MGVFIAARITVENRLSADYRNGYSLQEFRHVFRKVSRIIVSGVQNTYLDDFVRIQSIGQSFQKVVRDTAFADLRDGRNVIFSFVTIFIIFSFYFLYSSNVVNARSTL